MAQTVGRIARQGQTRPCLVYHFAVAGSVEERMLEIQKSGGGGEEYSGASAEAATAKGRGGGKAAAPTASKQDAQAASTDKLGLKSLLFLLDTAE